MPMDADDVKLGLKVVLLAGALMLLLRVATGVGHAVGASPRAPRPADPSGVMLRLDAARRPPLWASAD